MFAVGASLAFCLSGLLYPVAIRALRMAIWSQSFSAVLIFYHFVSFVSRRLSGCQISAFGLYPAYAAGGALSITPAGGVWRKVRADILQRVDASADFVSGSGGNVGAGAGFL